MRALTALAMSLVVSCGAGSWHVCIDAEGHSHSRTGDTNCSQRRDAGEAGSDALPVGVSVRPDGGTCCADSRLRLYSLCGQLSVRDLVRCSPAPAAVPAVLALPHSASVLLPRLYGPSGPSGPLTAHRTVVLRL